jgi:hypothetical protein
VGVNSYFKDGPYVTGDNCPDILDRREMGIR